MWRTAQFTLKTTLSFAMKSNVLYKTTYCRCQWFVISQPLEHPWGPGRLTWEGNGHPFENKTYFSGPLISHINLKSLKNVSYCQNGLILYKVSSYWSYWLTAPASVVQSFKYSFYLLEGEKNQISQTLKNKTRTGSKQNSIAQLIHCKNFIQLKQPLSSQPVFGQVTQKKSLTTSY